MHDHHCHGSLVWWYARLLHSCWGNGFAYIFSFDHGWTWTLLQGYSSFVHCLLNSKRFVLILVRSFHQVRGCLFTQIFRFKLHTVKHLGQVWVNKLFVAYITNGYDDTCLCISLSKLFYSKWNCWCTIYYKLFS